MRRTPGSWGIHKSPYSSLTFLAVPSEKDPKIFDEVVADSRGLTVDDMHYIVALQKAYGVLVSAIETEHGNWKDDETTPEWAVQALSIQLEIEKLEL